MNKEILNKLEEQFNTLLNALITSTNNIENRKMRILEMNIVIVNKKIITEFTGKKWKDVEYGI